MALFQNFDSVSLRFSMIFEPGYEPPSKKSCPSPRPGSSLEQAPLDCSKTESNGADLRIRQVGSQYQPSDKYQVIKEALLFTEKNISNRTM